MLSGFELYPRWVPLNSEASRYVSSAVHRPEGDSCFSIYQHMISWIKITKKGNFGTLKTSLSSNFVYNFQTFRGFFQVHFLRFCCKFSVKL